MKPALARGRKLAIGLLVVLLSLLWLCVVRPVAGAYAWQRAEMARNERIRDDLQRIAREGKALERQLAALATAQAGPSLTMAAESDGVAAAALQRVVKTALEHAGATLQSMQVKTPRQDGPFRRVGLRVQLFGSVEALRQALLALEAERPLVYEEELEVRARQQMHSTGKAIVEDRTLEIRLDVYGLAQTAS